MASLAHTNLPRLTESVVKFNETTKNSCTYGPSSVGILRRARSPWWLRRRTSSRPPTLTRRESLPFSLGRGPSITPALDSGIGPPFVTFQSPFPLPLWPSIERAFPAFSPRDRGRYFSLVASATAISHVIFFSGAANRDVPSSLPL